MSDGCERSERGGAPGQLALSHLMPAEEVWHAHKKAHRRQPIANPPDTARVEAENVVGCAHAVGHNVQLGQQSDKSLTD